MYTRTSRKGYIKQLTQIERRKARIRRIRARHGQSRSAEHEADKVSTESHHFIGVSQKLPESIPLFLQKHMGDPAIKVQISFNSISILAENVLRTSCRS